MRFIFPQSWLPVFSLETPLLELIVRGSVLFFVILIFSRIMPRRTMGQLALMDIVYLVLIAQAAANSLGKYSSILDGVVLLATFMTLNYFINILSYYIPFVEKLVSQPPVLIVRRGKPLLRNMRSEFITMQELLEKVREEGLKDIDKIDYAYVEGDGRISIIKNSKSA